MTDKDATTEAELRAIFTHLDPVPQLLDDAARSAFGVLQAAKVLDEAKPRRLDHVGGVGRGEPMRPRDGPHQSVVAVDEPVPSGLIPLCGGPYELSHFRHVARTYQTLRCNPDQIGV